MAIIAFPFSSTFDENGHDLFPVPWFQLLVISFCLSVCGRSYFSCC